MQRTEAEIELLQAKIVSLTQERDGLVRRIKEEEPIFHDLMQQLATVTQHLEAQRQATYQAVEREHACKQQLAQACRIIRDGYGVVPITEADVAWATEAMARKAQP